MRSFFILCFFLKSEVFVNRHLKELDLKKEKKQKIKTLQYHEKSQIYEKSEKICGVMFMGRSNAWKKCIKYISGVFFFFSHRVCVVMRELFQMLTLTLTKGVLFSHY